MKRAMVIGGGAVGLSVANEIADLFLEVYVVEKESRVGEHASSRSSQVAHAGLYYPTDSLKAKLCVEGNTLLQQFCNDHDIPFRSVGKLVVALDEKEDASLDTLLCQAEQNGVPDVRKISGREVQNLEPQVRCYSALHVPTSGIFDSARYLRSLAAVAWSKDVQILPKRAVTGISSEKKKFIVNVRTNDFPEEPVNADVLINTAGIFSDEIATMVNPKNDYHIIPVRGEAAKFYSSERTFVSTNIYPVPHQHTMENGDKTFTTGVHFTPTFSKEITIGPYLVAPLHKEDYAITTPLEQFYEKVATFFPSLRMEDLHIHQAGISAKLAGHSDFVITQDKDFNQCIHLLGIDSPGLTASLAIGKYVKQMLKEHLL